jgi:nitroimidazol reductase NimA-like FMN-containing flavoprotein (pyridoxamine 5'-phosphate oxidase superfamily)
MTALDAARCREVLDRARVAHIAQIAGGEPYVTPMSFVMLEGDLVFRTAPGQRVEALRADPRVCIEVTVIAADESWESVVLRGRARLDDDPTREAAVVAALLAKYHSDSPLAYATPEALPAERQVVTIQIDEVSGRTSGSGPETTRPGRL